MSKKDGTNKKTSKSKNPANRRNKYNKYIYQEDPNLSLQKTNSKNSFKRFLKRFHILGISFWLSIGTIFGITVDRSILKKESHKEADELQDSIKEKINNMEDNEFYDFAKGIVVYHYNLENPGAPISIDQVKIGTAKGSNPNNPFKLILKERPDETKYFEQIDLSEKKEDEISNQEEQTKTGNGTVMTVTIRDPEDKQHIIKEYKAARGGFFGNGAPLEVYEYGEDTSKTSFLTENPYAYDILAKALTVYDHNNNIPAKIHRYGLMEDLPSYYIDILTEQIKEESKKVPVERIEGITVNAGIINEIEEKYGVKLNKDQSEVKEKEEKEEEEEVK